MKKKTNILARIKQWILSIVSNSNSKQIKEFTKKVKLAKEKIKFSTTHYYNEEMIFVENKDEIREILGLNDNLSSALFIKFYITENSIEECVNFLIENSKQ